MYYKNSLSFFSLVECFEMLLTSIPSPWPVPVSLVTLQKLPHRRCDGSKRSHLESVQHLWISVAPSWRDQGWNSNDFGRIRVAEAQKQTDPPGTTLKRNTGHGAQGFRYWKFCNMLCPCELGRWGWLCRWELWLASGEAGSRGTHR